MIGIHSGKLTPEETVVNIEIKKSYEQVFKKENHIDFQTRKALLK